MADGVDFKDVQRRMEGAIGAFKHDLASLRTGRASSNLLDPIVVQAYGSPTPINQVASVSVPEPRMISVSVWDRSLVSAVDRAIREANLGFNPIVDGTNLRIPLPELNEQRVGSDRIQKMTDDTISTIDSLLAEKEAEIMQV